MILSSISVVVTLILLGIAGYFIFLRDTSSEPSSREPVSKKSLDVPVDNLTSVDTTVLQEESTQEIDSIGPSQASTVDSEFRLLEFSFEPKLLPGRVPDAST